jgi:hypothetical protein
MTGEVVEQGHDHVRDVIDPLLLKQVFVVGPLGAGEGPRWVDFSTLVGRQACT